MEPPATQTVSLHQLLPQHAPRSILHQTRTAALWCGYDVPTSTLCARQRTLSASTRLCLLAPLPHCALMLAAPASASPSAPHTRPHLPPHPGGGAAQGRRAVRDTSAPGASPRYRRLPECDLVVGPLSRGHRDRRSRPQHYRHVVLSWHWRQPTIWTWRKQLLLAVSRCHSVVGVLALAERLGRYRCVSAVVVGYSAAGRSGAATFIILYSLVAFTLRMCSVYMCGIPGVIPRQWHIAAPAEGSVWCGGREQSCARTVYARRGGRCEVKSPAVHSGCSIHSSQSTCQRAALSSGGLTLPAVRQADAVQGVLVVRVSCHSSSAVRGSVVWCRRLPPTK